MPIHIYLSHADYDSINNEKYINRLYIRIRDAKLFRKLDRIEQDGRKAEITFHKGVGSKNKLKRNVRALPLGLYRKLNGECFLKIYNDKKATDLISYILAMVTAIALATLAMAVTGSLLWYFAVYAIGYMGMDYYFKD